MEELYQVIENIGKIAKQAGMTAQEFNEYLQQLATIPPMSFEYDKKPIWTFTIPKEYETIEKEEKWSWLDKDDINE